MTKDKEQVKSDVMGVICAGWTWGKLTQAERLRFVDAVSQISLSGTYQQRHDTLHAMYLAFLSALDYKPTGWRSE
jgi:hypothetical protein